MDTHSSQKRATAERATCLLVCSWLLVLARSAPSPSPQQPGVVLFHKGDDALDWDHDELVRVRNLHSADVSDVKEFLAADSVASYLRLSPVEAMHMPVPVNILFVGFQGDGNMRVNISTEQLQEWFGHLDHVLPHTRVELSELSCAEDGHCAGLVHGSMQAQPVASYVHLNFSCNVIITKRGGLASVFERAIHVFSRPVDPAIEMGAQQVDAARMEAFIDNFLMNLGLLESGYTLLVINPTWSVNEPVYGYRMGLSQAEMDAVLHKHDKVKELLHNTYMLQEPAMTAPEQQGGHQNWIHRLSRHQQPKFGALDATWSAEMWTGAMHKYLDQVEEYRKGMLKAVGEGPGAAALAQAVTLLKRHHNPISSVLQEELLFNDPFSSVYSKFRTMHPAEDCLVGNWVGHSRWAMVDLTAGGFDWGPALGGEGVVHKHSLPNVVDHFSALQNIKNKHIAEASTQQEKTIMADLQQQTQAHKSQKATTAYMAFSQELSSSRKKRSPDDPPPTPEESKEEKDAATRKWRLRYQETLLKAELEMAEQFASRHCASGQGSSKLCMQLKDSAMQARNTLAKLAGGQAMLVDVWRDVRWDVFGSDDHDLELESDEVAYEAQRSRDMFLGELNGVLSRALRHVIAPPTASWTHAPGQLHDTATPFARHVSGGIPLTLANIYHPKVTFDIYLVRDSVHAGADQSHVLPSFNLAAYQTEVSRLAVSGQTFEFTRHEVMLQDDLVLATAFATAQRSSAQEVPSESDMVHEAERIWVDSRVLASVLRQRFQNTRTPASGSHGISPYRQSVLDDWEANAMPGKRRRHAPPPPREGSKYHDHYRVPVFIFELHREYAILLDEHYNAKALEDMIMVMQNAARDDEHPTGMMCGGALLARPLSPLREALSATLLHLAGVLPPHLGYLPARHRVQHDWLWSVGSHPQSFTSVGTSYTEIQKDALARSYLLDAVDSSVDLVNEGIGVLTALRPSQPVHKHIAKNKATLAELLALWHDLLAHWRAIMEASWHLNWGVATMQLGGLEDKSLKFMHLAQKLAAVPAGGHCAGVIKPSTEHLVMPTLVLSCVLGAGALVWLLWPAVFVTKRGNKTQYTLRI